MSEWDSMLESDALGHIKSLGALPETYTFRDGTTKEIYVLTTYNAIAPYGSGQSFSPTVDIQFCANNTDGVAQPIIGAETITIKGRQSDSSTKTYTLGGLVGQDSGLWHFSIPVQG